ncbi:MAG: hypothetical protein ACT4QC_01780 [Planctomycetaceae bacterium]
MLVKISGSGNHRPPAATRNGALSGRMVIGFAVGAVALLICGGILLAARSSRSQEHDDRFLVGDEVLLDTGTDVITLPIDLAAWTEFQRCVAADDNVGLLNMGLSGKSFSVSRGTRAKLVDREQDAIHVRIMEGNQVHKAGWIAREFVKLPK